MYCPNPECPDFKETGVPGEYVTGVTVCPYCGSYLVEQMPDMNPPPEQPAHDATEQHETKEETEDFTMIDDLGEELVAVASYSLRQDADLAISYLISQGIDVFESADDCGGTVPILGFTTGTRLMVPKSQAEQAVSLLDQVEKDE
ncbi:MAG: hypothetical protein JXA41_13600 [Deltaproteobacteria bacterium]|nr:hypothetical protein [Deltaproteobacteria bacterium]